MLVPYRGVFTLNKKAGFLALVILVTLLMAITASATYNETYDINASGNSYFLLVSINVREIRDYGVFAVYMTPQGVYAYGLLILKDPDEEKPHLYLMLGTQDKWYDLGYLENSNIYFVLGVDFSENKSAVILGHTLKWYNLTKGAIKPSKIMVSYTNITGRKSPIPDIIIKRLEVYVTNKTVGQLIDVFTNETSPINSPYLVLAVNANPIMPPTTTTATTTVKTMTDTSMEEATTSHASASTMANHNFAFLLALIGAFILVIVTVFVLFVNTYRTRRTL